MKGRYKSWGGRKIIRREDIEGARCFSCGKQEVEMIEVERKEGESEEVGLVMEVCKSCKYVVEWGLGKEDWGWWKDNKEKISGSRESSDIATGN